MMKRIALLLLAAVILYAGDDRIPTGMNQFATAAYSRISPGAGNIIFSPFNISTALSMALAGARGQTASEISAVLHQPSAGAAYHTALASLVGQLTQSANTAGDELSMANGLWVEKGLPIQSAFEQTIRVQYGAPLTPLTFSTNVEAARAQINSWTSEHTKGKIPELFGPGSLDSRTRLVITSAIYFNGRWRTPFQPRNTSAAPFKLQAGGTAQTNFMKQTGSFDYAETPSLQILEIKYADQSLAFDVLLPKSAEGLAGLEKSLTAENLTSWLATLSDRRVELLLPRFHAESEFQLVEVLAAMGMPSAFQSSADFSGIDGRRDLAVSRVVHKAFVDVSEQGTEAAAATGMAMSRTSLSPPATIFRADHPFVFLIRDTRSGVILFAGRLVKPQAL